MTKINELKIVEVVYLLFYYFNLYFIIIYMINFEKKLKKWKLKSLNIQNKIIILKF
jgi:hypothetical protein